MEYKTSKLIPEEELAIIKATIPTANNLPENLNTLRLMGLEELDIKDIFADKPVLVFEGIINPKTGQKILAGPTRIELDRTTDDNRQQIFINSRPAEEFFDKPLPDTRQERDIDRLIDENETLRQQVLEFQTRYDDIWDYCKELERKFHEEQEKLKN